jgi:leucine efflux protein
MFEIQNYGSFIAAILVFQLIPGPGTLAILNATARNGIRAGIGAVMGTLVGDFAFMIAAILGLAAVMKSTPMLFQALQWFGAAYLCWLGIQLLRSKVDTVKSADEEKKSGWVYFRQAFAVCLTNPKAVLFFVAFFPLFLKSDSSSLTLAAMVAHVTVISFAYQAALVLLGNAVAKHLAALPSARKIATRLAGIALVGFGIKLALNDR